MADAANEATNAAGSAACEDLGAPLEDVGSGTGGTLSPEECIASLSRPYTGGSQASRAQVPKGRCAEDEEPSEGALMSAAAAIGGAAGMLLAGPVSAATVGVAAAYATTRPGATGTAVRSVSKVGLKAADLALDEGRRRLAEGLDAGALDSVPGPVRQGIRAAVGTDKRTRQRVAELSEEAQRMRDKYPDRVPILLERAPYATDLPEIDKKKIIVPGKMLCYHFKYIVHSNIVKASKGSLGSDWVVYIFVNGVSPRTSALMADLYDQYRSDDGFLHVHYGAENTLGSLEA